MEAGIPPEPNDFLGKYELPGKGEGSGVSEMEKSWRRRDGKVEILAVGWQSGHGDGLSGEKNRVAESVIW